MHRSWEDYFSEEEMIERLKRNALLKPDKKINLDDFELNEEDFPKA